MSAGEATLAASGASQATEIVQVSEAASEAPTLVLQVQPRPNIRWTDDTVDNEHLGRRSSKRCCIFHKIKKFGDSDSDETSSDEDKGDAHSGESNEGGAGVGEEAAGGRPKKKPIKNFQRHHA